MHDTMDRLDSEREARATGGVLSDLTRDDLLQLLPGERLWKLFCIRPSAGRHTDLRHWIYTKVKVDGRLAMVTFAVHTPTKGRQARSAIARVPDLSAAALEQIIESVRKQALAADDEYEETDLRGAGNLSEQLRLLSEAET